MGCLLSGGVAARDLGEALPGNLPEMGLLSNGYAKNEAKGQA